jgi:ribosomal protein S18 acetylase RimI-like enzyme
MNIRPATKNDTDACLALDDDQYWAKEDFQKAIKNANAIFLVAEQGATIIGYIIGFIVPTKTDEAMLHETRVAKIHRKKRIGTRLVNNFCKHAFQQGTKSIYAEIKPELLPFYKDSCGFEESDTWTEVVKRR